MAQVSNVAKFLLYLASQDESVNDLSNLKLQKLLYYSQASSIQHLGEPLFREPLEAWQFGPVVKEVYQSYNSYGSLPINHNNFSDEEMNNNFGLTQQEIQAIIIAWEQYANSNPWELVESTHSEYPWRNAWNNGRREINLDDMMQEFKEMEFETT